MRGRAARERAARSAHVPPPSLTAPNEGFQGATPLVGGPGGQSPPGLLPNRTQPGHASTRVPLRAGQAAAVPGRPRRVTVVRVKLLMVPCRARKCSSTEASR